MTIVARLVQWLIDRLSVSYQKLDEIDPRPPAKRSRVGKKSR